MRRFLRKSTSNREPLPLVMAGVRMGERLLQVGLADVRLMTRLAAKPGISGRSALVVQDDADVVRATSAAANAGILLEVNIASDRFPFDDRAFDVVVAHRAGRSLTECHRVLRDGGRLVALEPGAREGLAAWFRQRLPERLGGVPCAPPPEASGMEAALRDAGFSAVRLLADRDGYRFTEGLKRQVRTPAPAAF